MKWYYVIFVLLVVVLLTGCAANTNEMIGTAGTGQEVVGFWLGLWYGMISPISFIVSLLDSDIGIYEIHNNGNWYNFGFLLGIGGGASQGISRIDKSSASRGASHPH